MGGRRLPVMSAMDSSALITAERLRALIDDGAAPVLLDCGFDLVDTGAGERAYAAGHLPGARYAHLDRDLSGSKHPDGPRSAAFTGRHPLPDRAAFAQRVGAWGIAPETPVVAYDAQGAPYAARAWWMLRWLGHRAVAVLDGGLAAWVEAGGPLMTTPPAFAALPPYPASPLPAMPTIDAETLARQLGQLRLIDARTVERWRGDAEPLDPVAGHIPGSLPRFFKENLDARGRFKPADELRRAFAPWIDAAAAEVVHQCGSGVAACHNILAMTHAGLGDTTLYAGSWSEWCADPGRPVARG